MPLLGVITCEVLEREVARLLLDPAVERVTVIADLHSRRLIELLEANGCRELEVIPHINSFRPEPAHGLRVVVRVLDLALHRGGERLRKSVSAAAREMARRADALLLCYGACGNALDPRRGWLDVRVPVFLPLDGGRPVDDCVALCLGGRAAYRREQLRTPGTFFLTPGWAQHWRRMLQGGESPERQAASLRRLFREYRRALLVVTPVLAEEEQRAAAEPLVRILGLPVEVREGSDDLLARAWRRAKEHLGEAKELRAWP